MPPSVYDTHCEGPGGLSSTKIWGPLRRLYHQYFNEDGRYQPLPPRQDLSGKTVIISGCNSGIGKEAAFVFAQWGAQVIMACRDAPSYEQHPKETIREFLTRPGSNIKESQLEWWEVDFASLQSVKAFGKKWKESGRVCDILCNNAGIGGVNGRIITSDGFEFVNQINFLSHCLLTFYVLPSMKKVSTRCMQRRPEGLRRLTWIPLPLPS
jgi:NAD(P)-dependent dehydrogenase (short-subunit alcohol dehydrogenase family)